MPISDHTNFALSTLASPPSGTAGTSLSVQTGHGTLFPAVPFNATIWPPGVAPTASNAEIVRVTAKSGDDFTVSRAQESSTARTHGASYQIAATITKRTLTDAEYGAHGIVNPLDPAYGAVGDGTTDDTAALTAAITAAMAGPYPLYVPAGYTFACSTWSTVTTTGLLTIRGGGSIKCTNATRVAFVTLGANCDFEGVTFDGWFRVISNPTGTAGTLTGVRVANCTFLNATAGAANTAYYILVQNAVSNVRILNNTFTGALRTPIYIGDNVYANQDTWSDIWVVGNTITGVTAPTAPAYAFGVLIYGRDVLVDGNEVSSVEGPSSYNASNGAYGIYTKARFCRVVNNNVTSIGLSTNCDVEEIRGINVKGADRADVTQPQGYNAVVANNIVRNVGVMGTSGYGISLNHSDITCNNNIVEECGLKGIFALDQAASADGSVTITSNTVLATTGAATHGIEVVPWGSAFTVQGNIVDAVGHGIRVRSNTNAGGNVVVSGNISKNGVGIRCTAATVNLSNITIHGNNVMGGSNGVYFDESGGGVLSDILVCDNDLSGSTTKMFGLPTSGVRVRNNIGYVTEKGGTSAAIATGATIAHGLAAAPTAFYAIPQATAATDVYVTADATNLTVTFGGGGTVAFAWEAKTAAHYA